MTPPKHLIFIVIAWLAVIGAPRHGYAAGTDDEVRGHVDRAKAAFGLGKYDEAASAYEAAFQAKPAPALLYNAAQTHRMAGHKARALELYQSYLRLYRTGPNRDESEQHVANLTRALEEERKAATAPPNGIAEPDNAPAPSVPTVAAVPAAAPEPRSTPEAAVGMRLDRQEEDRPLTSKPWFWVAVGGAAAAVVATVLVISLSGSSSAPAPTAGTFTAP